MDFKYQVYYSTSLKGPWTLSNPTPIDHLDDGMSHAIIGLTSGVTYYIVVIGGVMDGADFIPLMNQSIGSSAVGARGVDQPTIPPTKVLYRTPGGP